MEFTENQLIIWINKALSDTTTGPLSDTPYSDTSVNGDQQLELWEESNSGWPSATIDTPQLARELLESMEGYKA